MMPIKNQKIKLTLLPALRALLQRLATLPLKLFPNLHSMLVPSRLPVAVADPPLRHLLQVPVLPRRCLPLAALPQWLLPVPPPLVTLGRCRQLLFTPPTVQQRRRPLQVPRQSLARRLQHSTQRSRRRRGPAPFKTWPRRTAFCTPNSPGS